MSIIQIVGLSITGAVLSLVVKEQKPVFSLCIALGTSLIVFLFMLEELSYLLDVVRMISSRLALDKDYIQIVFRIVGITYVTRFSSDLCKDAGQVLIGQKIEMAGKITIMVLSIPIITGVLNLLIGILPG